MTYRMTDIYYMGQKSETTYIYTVCTGHPDDARPLI